MVLIDTVILGYGADVLKPYTGYYFVGRGNARNDPNSVALNENFIVTFLFIKAVSLAVISAYESKIRFCDEGNVFRKAC